jgi:FixJ family two-component response regulator
MTDAPYVAVVDDSTVMREAILDVFRSASIDAEAFGSARDFLDQILALIGGNVVRDERAAMGMRWC